jgi:hypothetical protein
MDLAGVTLIERKPGCGWVRYMRGVSHRGRLIFRANQANAF